MQAMVVTVLCSFSIVLCTGKHVTGSEAPQLPTT